MTPNRTPRWFGSPANFDAATARSNEIDEQLKKERVTIRGTRFIALFGAPGAGRSTFLRQAKLHGSGYNTQEREELGISIQTTVISAIRLILEGASIPDDPTVQLALSSFLEATEPGSDTTNSSVQDQSLLAYRIQELLAVRLIKEVIEASPQYQADSSLQYTMGPIPRIMTSRYTPTDIDILRGKFPPAPPIVEIPFKPPGAWNESPLQTTLVSVRRDNGLQRKWLTLVGEVEAIIFLVDLSRYDQTEYLSETEEELNCIRAAMREFESICNVPLMRFASAIVVFNKFDLFTEQLTRVPFTECFPEYTGPNEPAAAVEYCTDRFQALYCVFGVRQRNIRTWCTNCLDVDQTGVTLQEIMRSIVRLRLHVVWEV
ncbi:guanine nucleotide binding protein, alpha subunit [Mycena alexandri]|uniref:Guanine nucleotide binding protein, alpha subunit n=1 Tax=Mycena alexandri TaxID=1745969 RepID=A0AAD6SSL1_9AGAR|nr:guanine nucleotide binding protein, alpha subunit [Mycena alexandri]